MLSSTCPWKIPLQKFKKIHPNHWGCQNLLPPASTDNVRWAKLVTTSGPSKLVRSLKSSGREVVDADQKTSPSGHDLRSKSPSQRRKHQRGPVERPRSGQTKSWNTNLTRALTRPRLSNLHRLELETENQNAQPCCPLYRTAPPRLHWTLPPPPPEGPKSRRPICPSNLITGLMAHALSGLKKKTEEPLLNTAATIARKGESTEKWRPT